MMRSTDILDRWLSEGAIDRFSAELGWRLARLARVRADVVALAGATVNRALESGHVYVSLEGLSETLAGRAGCTSGAQVREALLQSGIAVEEGGYAPLVIDAAGRVYLHRYWRYECDVANDLRARASVDGRGHGDTEVAAALTRWFGPVAADAAGNEQRIAAAVAVLKRFAVITGGPGTGKTVTAARLLGMLVELEGTGHTRAGRPLRIALAAPTGKAASRLAEAIRAAKTLHSPRPELAAAIPDEAVTIHRLLRARGAGGAFRQGAPAPLPVDIVLIDEASMVDLAMMARLVAAVPHSARLILLGDPDQLASVEAGAVLSSLVADPGAARPEGALSSAAGCYSAAFASRLQRVTGAASPSVPGARVLSDCVARLTRSRRFAAESAVGALARATLQGDAAEVLRQGHPQAGEARAIARSYDAHALTLAIGAGLGDYTGAVRAGAAPEQVFAAFNRFRVLCAHRRGPRGAESINRRIEGELRRDALHRGGIDGEWFAGRAIMVVQNDYALRLFNGDIGIALPDSRAGGALRVFFPEATGGARTLIASRLPAFEPAFALTVHKSQGSEFDRVLLVLPDEVSPVVTRELLYTAVTRAREAIQVFGSEEVFRLGVATRQQRDSGLAQRLWGSGSESGSSSGRGRTDSAVSG